ncbi:enoyl-[acyl-carrier-protein] reductase, mitochondrial-like [Amphiura filiformis]|uniref:enoyl-[acyl-carrier-protein] reductase, mitochondrial-like n=1 Tax=Amphiura filiformis TaxID=82378 RepID=UPI003B219239
MSASMSKLFLFSRFSSIQHFQTLPKRAYATCVQTKALVYNEYGDPSKVVKCAEIKVDDLTSQSVRVQMLAAPINPADINTIQGVYPLKPDLPAVGGFEGVGKVVEVGKDVTDIKPGDIVLPAINTLGTWRNELVCSSHHVMSIPHDTPIVTAAGIKVNGCTAYRMLHDYVLLSKGDSIIQNASNSGAGQAVIQIAAALGINSINIIRDRPGIQELKNHLKSLGATLVFTEEEARTEEARKHLQSIPKPKLAFNAVGGKSVINLIKCLQPGSTIVTYGGMSRQPLMIPTASLIFNDIKLAGYWMSRWHEQNKQSPEAQQMIQQLCTWAKQGQLRPPQYSEVSFQDYHLAIERTMEGFTSSKQILRFES